MTRAEGGNRERIIEGALALFNEQGTGPVSTNHVAKAAGVSPGNLYYHFHNKHEIIREIYIRQVNELAPRWEGLRMGGNVFLPVVELIFRTFEVTWRYRFLARELSSLIQQDPWLEERIRENYRTRSAMIQPLISYARQARLLNELADDLVVSDLNRLIWMVTYYWISFFDLESEEQPGDRILEGTRLCVRIFEPYLAAEVRSEVLAFLETLRAR